MQRSLAWLKDDDLGAEYVEVQLDDGRLRASGVAIGREPVPYRLDYVLETARDLVTSRLQVETRSEGWSRSLDLRRSAEGVWTASWTRRGSGPWPGESAPAPGKLPDLRDALDCDLGLSPLTNTIPVLRLGLLHGGQHELLAAWVSVPDLGVIPSLQRYAFLRREGNGALIRYEDADGDFAADVLFDENGLVVSYPGIGRRL